ncbi:MAG: hypothetical protein AAB288_09260 [Acidobacteriota bacterium]
MTNTKHGDIFGGMRENLDTLKEEMAFTPFEERERWAAELQGIRVEAEKLTQEINAVIVKLQVLAIQAGKIGERYGAADEGLRSISKTDKESEE